MTVEAILFELLDCGIEPAVTPDGTGIEVPAGRLTDAQRAAIVGHKNELIAAIMESARITSELLQVAMRAAAHWGDNPEDWRQQCLEVPPHQRPELLAYLQTQYGRTGQ